MGMCWRTAHTQARSAQAVHHYVTGTGTVICSCPLSCAICSCPSVLCILELLEGRCRAVMRHGTGAPVLRETVLCPVLLQAGRSQPTLPQLTPQSDRHPTKLYSRGLILTTLLRDRSSFAEPWRSGFHMVSRLLKEPCGLKVHIFGETGNKPDLAFLAQS